MMYPAKTKRAGGIATGSFQDTNAALSAMMRPVFVAVIIAIRELVRPGLLLASHVAELVAELAVLVAGMLARAGRFIGFVQSLVLGLRDGAKPDEAGKRAEKHGFPHGLIS